MILFHNWKNERKAQGETKSIFVASAFQDPPAYYTTKK